MLRYLSALLLLTFLAGSISAQTPSASEILRRSISFHDPQDMWPSLQAKFQFSETRPNGPDRSSVAEIDNSQGWFKLDRRGTESHGMKMDSCFVIYGEADCDRAARMRNYYVYLWGLPMKLMDEGTSLDPQVREKDVDGKPCYVLRVPYEEDIWYFYMAQSDYRMVAYEFFKDEATGKGELITTDGVYTHGAMKFPNNRTWYELPGKRVLGTDILTKVETLE